MTNKMKKQRGRIIITIVMFLLALMVQLLLVKNNNINLVMYLTIYYVIGIDIIKKAIKNIARGQIFDENFLMTIATIGAFFIGDYPEAVIVMLLYQIGELVQSYAVNRSRKSIGELMDIRPDSANVIREGVITLVHPEEVRIGDVIVVKPGEKIPLDGMIISGNTMLDTKALTGESVPRDAMCGSEVISGCINITGLIEMEVSKEFGESTVSKILNLVENASSKKAKSENFITKFAKWYTPIVVILALLLAVIPPLFFGGNWNQYVYGALSFLVISCPCALVISVPLSFFGGIGGASKLGILVKGSNYLETLAMADTVVMDKTGTLTEGSFLVNKIVSIKNDISSNQLLEITAYVESNSNHPISKSLLQAYGKSVEKQRIGAIEEIVGFGIKGEVDNLAYFVGNDKLMMSQGIEVPNIENIGTIVHVAQQKEYLGYIVISDEIKEDSKNAIDSLHNLGIKNIVMLSGDRKATVEYVGNKLGIERLFWELSPIDKVDKIEELLLEKKEKGTLLFAGDGINDAPVLARADIGIAMGGLGSDAAIEAADIVIMTDEPLKIATGIKLARKTLKIVKQNIVFAIGVKIFILLLAAFQITSLWAAIFADVGVSVLAILNAMRAMKLKE